MQVMQIQAVETGHRLLVAVSPARSLANGPLDAPARGQPGRAMDGGACGILGGLSEADQARLTKNCNWRATRRGGHRHGGRESRARVLRVARSITPRRSWWANRARRLPAVCQRRFSGAARRANGDIDIHVVRAEKASSPWSVRLHRPARCLKQYAVVLGVVVAMTM